MQSDHINVKLTGIHADAFRAYGTRITRPGGKINTPDVVLKMIETLPEFTALANIGSERTEKEQSKDPTT